MAISGAVRSKFWPEADLKTPLVVEFALLSFNSYDCGENMKLNLDEAEQLVPRLAVCVKLGSCEARNNESLETAVDR